MSTLIPARVGLQQRVFPEYRASFFNLLACSCLQGFSLFTGVPRPDEAIKTSPNLQSLNYQQGNNLHISNGRTYFCFQQGLIRWLERSQPSVLIVEANARYLATPAAIHWMHARRRPVIGWGLGAPVTGNLETRLRGQFLHSLDAIIAYSRKGAEQYAACGIDAGRIFVAPNAVSPKPVARPPLRPAHFTTGKPSLLFVGRLQERKRIDVLLKACAMLPVEQQPELVIVGAGPDRARLDQIARDIYPAAQFAGAKHGQELESYYHRADLLVLPGTGGLAVQQAMAHALPVIVGQADGTQGELVQPENGWVLPAIDARVLADTIVTALSDVKKLRDMGVASYHIVLDEVNIETMLESFAKAIKSVS